VIAMRKVSRVLQASAYIVAAALLGSAMTASDSKALVIDLGFALDESGSIQASDWNLARAGLSAALSVIPTSGADVYRISVVKFSSSAETVITRVINSAADLTAVQTAVATAVQFGGSTCISCGTALLTSNIAALSGGFGDKSIMNVTTDGEPNVGTTVGSTLRTATVASGWDAISAEAVGAGVGGTGLAFLQALVYPQPQFTTNNPALLPNPLLQGFVLQVDSFTDYQGAIGVKVQKIVDNAPDPTPIPGALPLFVSGLGAFGFLTWRRKRKITLAAA
jgi:hypothetical protein